MWFVEPANGMKWITHFSIRFEHCYSCVYDTSCRTLLLVLLEKKVITDSKFVIESKDDHPSSC
jgi:hypothetical protein